MTQQENIAGHGRAPDGASHGATLAGDDLATLRDENARLRATLEDAEVRERALRYELQHRVRNMLAVIRTIYRRSRESGASHEMFAEHFEGRLSALARYQSYVDEAGLGVELEDMVRNELLEAHCLDSPSCIINGPPVYLRQKMAELMGLAIHELATNSIKFGALAQNGGLAVEWSVEAVDGHRRLRFRWAESGVAVASPAPRVAGFGRQLIEEALTYQLGAQTLFDLKPGGIECTIVLSLPEGSVGEAGSDDLLADDQLLLPSEAE